MLQAEKLTSSSEKALANQFLAPGRVPTTAKERVPATKTVHLQSRARYTSEMRSELLGTESSGGETCRTRLSLPPRSPHACLVPLFFPSPGRVPQGHV
ncbi:rCG38791, isoform CRA_b [Rattus norvegicus]|uniref:Vesicle transport protein USE1 n=1 Tax=Rattus norvegicus TaxID=10116 RepID=A6K9S3_RAT|nr:rCG38791, isoform CRA_b [Rattus norvegicus]